MVFSINAIESGPNNFEAFKALAIQQNGTVSNSSTTTNTPSKSAGVARVSRGAGAAGIIAVTLAVFAML